MNVLSLMKGRVTRSACTLLIAVATVSFSFEAFGTGCLEDFKCTCDQGTGQDGGSCNNFSISKKICVPGKCVCTKSSDGYQVPSCQN